MAGDWADWADKTLGDVLTLQRGFDLPESDRKGGPYRVIASTGPVGTHDRAMVQGPGVVVGRSGSLGGGQFIHGDFWPLNTTLWVKDFKGNDPQFCYYLLKSLDLAHFNAGSGVPTLNRNHIHPLPVTVPSDALEQRAIAHILGTLDDKIELNRRMNETLDAMAQALFKSWFVDFDPVHAKAEGRNPGLLQPLADLFPDSFDDSALGEIPKGWKVGSLDSVLLLQRGFDLPATQRTPGPYPVLAASGPSGTHNESMVRGPGVTTGRSGVLGRVFYVNEDYWPLNTSLWVKEFRHSKPAYAFHLLRRLDFAAFNAGSAVPTLNRNHVHTLPTLRPPMELIDAFEHTAATALRRQRVNDLESQTLGDLRDTLLNKLISGEIRVRVPA